MDGMAGIVGAETIGHGQTASHRSTTTTTTCAPAQLA
jgi:hypothetical protein